MKRLCLALLLAGCLQSIDDGYDESSPLVDGGSPPIRDAGTPPTMCPDVERDVFQKTCGQLGCHDPMYRMNGLDLVSPGVANRIRTSQSTCMGMRLRQLMQLKLHPLPPCGAQMPLGGALSPEVVTCVEQYLDAL